jgi:cobaltochelatase CobS
MVGPAGTGKSHIAQQVAEALGLDYYPVSVGPQTSEAKLTGYCDANGNYIPRPHVRQAVEKGGLLFLDELDRSNPGVMTILNACLANGHMTFPDKVVPIHPDLRVLAAGNTYGTGPDRKFVGAQQIDGATLDRFAVETIDYDESLEHSLCLATGLDAGKVARHSGLRPVPTAQRQQRAHERNHRDARGCRCLPFGAGWPSVA